MSKFFKKRIVFILIIVFIIFVFSFYLTFFNQKNREILEVKNEILINKEKENTNNDFKKNIEIKNNITLRVLNKSYEIEINKGENLFEIMKRLEKENNFSFLYKEYSSLGIFVEEINGVRGLGGKYWIYSVNGKEGEVGILNYIVKSGDIISWELI